MDIVAICKAFNNGFSDGSKRKERVKQENFNLDESYNYGYDLASKEIKEGDIVA
jgi:hypothetical protein